jgi:hypothetical protein
MSELRNRHFGASSCILSYLSFILSCHLSAKHLASANVKMSGYERQSAIALDRYDPEESAVRALIFEIGRRMSRKDSWRRYRRQAWRRFVESGNQKEENRWN